MTTYLAIVRLSVPREITYAFCSRMCRHRYTASSPRIPRQSMQWRDDDHYEFDETCANCGALIPASA